MRDKTIILFLGINARFTHTCLPIYYLRTCLDPKKQNFIFVEKTINDPLWDIITTVGFIDFDVLCLPCYIWNQHYMQCILQDFKKIKKDVKIVCGGPDISYNAQHWLDRFPAIDYIITGPGESGFELLLNSNFQHPEKIISVKNKPLSQIPFPYRPDDKPFLANRYLYYEASRGCPCNCSYCVSSIEDQILEYKDIKTIKDDILKMLLFDPPVIKFVDRTFNANNELCLEILHFVGSLTTNTKFHFEINPWYLNKEQTKIIQKLFYKKRIQIEIGIQTTHNKTYALINRAGTWKETKTKVVNFLQSYWGDVHLDMIVGLPGEKMSDIILTFHRLLERMPQNIKIGSLKILPGTQLEKDADKWGYKYQEAAPYRIYSSNTLSFSDVHSWGLVEIVFDIMYNSRIMVRFNKAIIWNSYDFFYYYQSLAHYFYAKQYNRSLSDKQKIFQLVVEHLNFFYKPEYQEPYMDALRYDWFIHQDTHFYPDFLEAQHCDLFKKDLYEEFKVKWQELEGENKKMRNAVFYTFNDFEESHYCDGEAKVDGELFHIDLDDNYHIKKIIKSIITKDY